MHRSSWSPSAKTSRGITCHSLALAMHGFQDCDRDSYAASRGEGGLDVEKYWSSALSGRLLRWARTSRRRREPVLSSLFDADPPVLWLASTRRPGR